MIKTELFIISLLQSRAEKNKGNIMAIQNGDMIKKHNVALFVRNNDAVEWF